MKDWNGGRICVFTAPLRADRIYLDGLSMDLRGAEECLWFMRKYILLYMYVRSNRYEDVDTKTDGVIDTKIHTSNTSIYTSIACRGGLLCAHVPPLFIAGVACS